MTKLREGSYYPGWLLEPRRRAERALVAVVAECYVRGVSTRRVEGLVQTLGIESLSKSQVSRMAKELDVEVAAFRNRQLDAPRSSTVTRPSGRGCNHRLAQPRRRPV